MHFPRAFLSLFLSFMPLCSSSPGTEAATAWTPCTYLGEKAWSSTQASTRAIVSPSRSRLLYFGSLDLSQNLLCAPAAAPAPSSEDPSPNWGGHRFWLGPQLRWVWPPLVDWEFSAATDCLVEGSSLRLMQPQRDTSYPRLTRTYAWEGGRLRCTVAWSNDGRAYYGMHVFAIEAPADFAPQGLVSGERPEGFVTVSMKDYNPRPVPGEIPALAVQDGVLRVRSGSAKAAKLGFTPQTLRLVRAGGWALLVHPGPSEGIAVGVSDSGFLSQLWVGDASYRFCEMEQLSPFLLAEPGGTCASTCYLQAEAPSRSPLR